MTGNDARNVSRFRARFAIRHLIILVSLASLVLAIWVSLIRPSRQQANAMAWVRQHGGGCLTAWKGPAWLDREGLRFPAFNRIIRIDVKALPQDGSSVLLV